MNATINTLIVKSGAVRQNGTAWVPARDGGGYNEADVRLVPDGHIAIQYERGCPASHGTVMVLPVEEAERLIGVADEWDAEHEGASALAHALWQGDEFWMFSTPMTPQQWRTGGYTERYYRITAVADAYRRAKKAASI